MSKEEIEVPEFDWISLHNELNEGKNETTKEKMVRKIKENPFVPFGCLATAAALTYGLWSFRTGQKKMSQYMMRTRIAAQGFTIMALIVGLAMGATKVK